MRAAANSMQAGKEFPVVKNALYASSCFYWALEFEDTNQVVKTLCEAHVISPFLSDFCQDFLLRDAQSCNTMHLATASYLVFIRVLLLYASPEDGTCLREFCKRLRRRARVIFLGS